MDAVIHHILKTKSIVEYLERKGHQPFKMLSGGRLSYLCPFSDHNESKPSFMVWTNAEYENFHCFGCQRGYSIIHLVATLEGITYRQAVEVLGEGLEVSLGEDVKLQLELLDKKLSGASGRQEIAGKLYTIGTQCRYYLESVDYAESEVVLVDGFFSELDKSVLNLEFDALDSYTEHLSGILRQRREKYEALSRENQRAELEKE